MPSTSPATTRRARTLGLGCMRLSTDASRDDARSIAVIHAALDGGVTLLDTANAYAWHDDDVGHNERLIARALATWGRARASIRVATKGGLTRPAGAWVPDGRAKALRAACEASRRALGVDAIDLYQLHAIDPSTPFATSVRALARLKKDGLVRAVGLSNVTVPQIEAARELVEIEAVQVRSSPFDEEPLRNGVVAYCAEHGIELIAHSPFGGPRGVRRVDRDDALRDVAQRHGVSPFTVALAWLYAYGDNVVPIPGATRLETAERIGDAASIELDDEDRRVLGERFPAARLARPRRARPRPPSIRDGEVVLIIGCPGAGKSTLSRSFTEQGYERLNRDEAGGRLADLLPALAEHLAAGRTRIVLDNTYGARASRSEVVEVAHAHGVEARCVWLDTSVEDAQVNACRRMVERYGRLLDPGEMRNASRSDPGLFDPRALFRYRRSFEPPTVEEGFSRVEVVAFQRRDIDREASGGRALFLDYDGVLCDGEEPLPRRAAILAEHASRGFRLLATTWRPGFAGGALSDDDLRARLERIQARLGASIETMVCSHPAGPPICWCRKPMPGHAVELIHRHALAPAECIWIGRSAADRTVAKRVGVPYQDATEFFDVEVRTRPDR